MKVLLSAYACEPDRGSEPFLGWRWAREIAMKHEVWVITRENNRPAIEKYLELNPIESLHFCYVDLGSFARKLKKLPGGIQAYYHFWQIKACKAALALHAEHKFDLVHHLTFGAFTQPTFMYRLGIPFIWGPLGGGEKLPHLKGRHLDFKSRCYEKIRSIQISLYPFFPFVRKSVKKASKIFVTTEDTLKLIDKSYANKTFLMQSLGIDRDFMQKPVEKVQDGRIKILMVGRMIGWKGFDIGIDAFKILAKKHENVDLYLRGNGSSKNSLLKRCGDLLGKRIFYVDKFFNYEDMYGFYQQHDIFLNCSLHDSGCLALLEAMSAALPVVCISTGGPAVITNDSNAFRIKPTNYSTLLQDIVAALEQLTVDESLRLRMGKASKQTVEENFLYEKKCQKLFEAYNEVTRLSSDA